MLYTQQIILVSEFHSKDRSTGNLLNGYRGPGAFGMERKEATGT